MRQIRQNIDFALPALIMLCRFKTKLRSFVYFPLGFTNGSGFWNRSTLCFFKDFYYHRTTNLTIILRVPITPENETTTLVGRVELRVTRQKCIKNVGLRRLRA
uniref:Uncharacterized protein n=1 Tax=Candidatus Kentrum sp. LPFa TaxID=2126335 RepID=A0A450XNI6_9GAMM|nr:MAG: hypothetical protein BECKLPF1236A_GA0070988_101166 [Candidatus Kentron sp. LPFa]VFK30871.1 MAG: hypothetical protein BECKLPF1236C_GA0070990_101226 [Candidatus Kentron sp. LPFa]